MEEFMEQIVFWGILLITYTIWVIVKIIKIRAERASIIMQRATIFFIGSLWCIFLLYIGVPVFGNTSNNADTIVGCFAFYVMTGFFLAQYLAIKKSCS